MNIIGAVFVATILNVITGISIHALLKTHRNFKSSGDEGDAKWCWIYLLVVTASAFAGFGLWYLILTGGFSK